MIKNNNQLMNNRIIQIFNKIKYNHQIVKIIIKIIKKYYHQYFNHYLKHSLQIIIHKMTINHKQRINKINKIVKIQINQLQKKP